VAREEKTYKSIFVKGGDRGVGNNGNAVVVNVGGLVELLLEVGVLAVRSDTTRVEGSLVNVAVNHWRGQMVSN
jgi:hypothetical protein